MKHDRVTPTAFARALSPLVVITTTLAWALPARGGEIPFTEHVISTTADGAQSVFAADLDGDGDTDVLSASRIDGKIAWYENGGGVTPTFTEHVISTTARGTRSVFAADVNGDGSMNVISSSPFDNQIVWFEYNAELIPSFTPHVLWTSGRMPISVFATDVDGDGDTDILYASRFDNLIAWFENDGASAPTFTERFISTNAITALSVFAADVDSDGDTDVLSASLDDNKIAWYESDGGLPPTFTEHVISTNAIAARSVLATDLDRDGDTDVLSTSLVDRKFAWYENDGGSPPSFTERVIATGGTFAVSVFATDVDGDGNTDLLTGGFGPLAWFENSGGSPPSFTRRVVSTHPAIHAFATDVDGDGDIDVLSAGLFGDRIAWYENTTPRCGDGTVNSGEDCDGGLRCTDCLCDVGFEPTVPPSLTCRVACGNGALDPGEDCDGGLGCTACRCSAGTEPTVPPSPDCRPTCGSGVCGSGEDSCNCPGDCGTPPSNETVGGTCSDGIDNDCDGLTDSDDADCAAVPTVSAWGLIAMSLLLLAGAKGYFHRRRVLA